MSFTMPAQNTSNITEGSNLYYTNARADARIVNAGSANWNTAYGWGNHASAGYVTSSGNTIIGTDTDLSFSGANVLSTIALTDGVITAYTNRVLTLANLGYTGETNATADQTNAEIRAAVEAATDSNVFTNADHSKLDGIATGATNTAAPHYTSAIAVGAGGLTQQNFTTTLKNKLDGIAASANNYVLPFTNNSSNWNTAYGWGNHASAGYLTSVPNHSAALITSGNLANARMSTAYLATRLGLTAHSLTTLNTTALWSQPAGYQTMVKASTSTGLPSSHGQSYFGYNITSRRDTGTGYSALLTSYDNSNMYFTYNTVTTAYPTWRKLWHDSNDGSGSGLDADLLDGQQGSYYRAYANLTGTPTIPSLSGYATESYVGTQISNLVDSSPAALNTLNELAAAIGDDASFSTTVTNNIATKAPLASPTFTGTLIAPIIKVGDGTDGRFYSDTAGRTAFANGDFYIQDTVTNYFNYATNQYHGNSSGDNHFFRGNPLSGNSWSITAAGVITAAGGNSGNWNTAYTVANAALPKAGGTLTGDVVIGTTGADTELSVKYGQIIGGFGARTTGGTTDWNHSTNARSGNGYTLLLAGHTNGPSGSGYFHPFSFEYAGYSGGGNMTQFAMPYNNSNMHFRSRYSGSWSSWNKVWTSGNDGSSSGLDADLLDGQQGSYYATASGLTTATATANAALPKAGGTMTGDIVMNASIQLGVNRRILGGTTHRALEAHTNGTQLQIGEGYGLINLFKTQNAVNELKLYNNRQDLSNVGVSKISGYNGVETSNMTFYRGGGGSSGYIRFQTKPTNAASLTDQFQIGDSSTVGYGVNVPVGGYRINGTTAIDANRQIFARGNTQVGEDGTYGNYGVLGFGGITNGYNRVFGNNSTGDGLFLAAATGRNVFVRSNGEGSDSITLGTDGTYSSYKVVGFGSTVTNGRNRIFARADTTDGLYINSATGRDIYFRTNGSGSNAFVMTSAGAFQVGSTTVIDSSRNISGQNFKPDSGYHYQRSDHHSGHLEGSYNNIGGNGTKSNPIYTIGSSYNPGDAALSNMYGIGYTDTSASFINFTGAGSWGMYVAADGDARVWLGGSNGVISSTGQHYVGSNVVWNAGNDGSGSGLDADLLDGLNSTQFLRSDTADTATQINSPIFSGTISTTGDGQNNYPFRLGSDYNSYMVATASNTWGLFWAGNSGSRYGTNGNGGPGNIWGNSTNPNEFCFVGGDSTRWSVQGSSGDTWQLGTARTGAQGILWGASNDGSGSGLDADLLDGQQPSASGGANKIAQYASNGYLYPNNWIHPNNGTGLFYSAGVHFYEVGNKMYSSTSYTSAVQGTLWGSSNDGAGSGLDADLLDGRHLQQIARYQSGSDFANGTLVTTDIASSGTNGDSFVIEVTGKAYGSSRPHSVIAEGYLYNNTIINTNGTNISGSNFTYLKVMSNGGYLSFWWPRHGYWNSYDVHVRSSSGGTANYNRVTAIANSVDPSGASKKIQINLATSWNSSNDGSGSGLDADLLDGYNAEETAVNNSIVKRDGTATIKVNGVYLGGTGAANKLEDYEEGTWTPTSTAVTSLGINFAKYTKIGNQVTVLCQFYGIPNVASTVSWFYDPYRIGGLPFQPNADAVGGVGKCGGQYFYAHNAVARSGTNYIEFYTQGSQNSPSEDNDVYLTSDHFDYGNDGTQANNSNDHVDITITYLTDQ